MISGAVDRDLFQEIEPENKALLGTTAESYNHEVITQRKWVIRLLFALEVLFSRRCYSPMLLYLSRSRHFLSYNLREILKRKVGYCLGMLSCVLVVLAVTTTVTVTDQLPIIFLRIGENERGQYDLIVWSDRDVGHTLNFTHLVETMSQASVSEEHAELFSLVSPRIYTEMEVFSHKSCKKMNNGEDLPIWDTINMQWVYGYSNYTNDDECKTTSGKNKFCPVIKCSEKNAGYLIAYDHDLEETMGFGREWEHKQLKAGECIISKELSDDFGVGIGDDLLVQAQFFNSQMKLFLGMLLESGFISEPDDPEVELDWDLYQHRNDYFIIPLRIVAIESTFQGKNDHEVYGSSVVYVDYESLYSHISNYIDQKYAEFVPRMKQTSPYHYAREIYLNHPNRVDLYNSNNYQSVRHRVTGFTGQFLYLAGFDQLEADYPLLYFLLGTRFIGLFLSLIINIIITILVGLSVILIYSLLMINVEERTFEMGVLRMIGLKLTGLVEMIVMQSLLYSLPGIVLGLVAGEMVYLTVSFILQYYLKAKVPSLISVNSILIGIGLGLLIPLVGSVLPIRKAMGRSLNESLDMKRSKTKAVKIKIERLTDTSVSWSLMIMSGGSFGFGFFIYYFFPLALITGKFELLLTLFFVIILMMLVGCVLLALNLESIIQSILTRIIFFWEFASVRKLIVKNLVAHKTRNRKTTIMYSISLGFLIFIAVSTRLEIRMYEFTNKRIYGTELTIDLPGGREGKADLNHPGFLGDLDGMVESEALLEDYCFVSIPISSMTNDTGVYVETIGQYWWESMDMQAVSPNFFDIMDREYLRVSKQNGDTGFGLSEQLYSVEGTMGFVGGKGEHKNMGLTSLDENVVYIQRKPTEQFQKYRYSLMRYLSVLNSAAGTTFSKYDRNVGHSRLENGKSGHDGFVSFPALLTLMEHEEEYNRVEDIPLRYIYLKLASSPKNKGERMSKISDLKFKLKRSFAKNKISAEITDVNELLERIKVVDNVLTVFYYLSTVLAMTMCFFSLVSNMYTNVHEQSKEIGILRAIGCRKCTLRRIYVYEALIIIYTSGIIGSVIGMFIGYTLVLQQQLFSQLPLSFVVPYEIIIIVISVGIICGFLSSICPINLLLKNNPVMIMRKVF